MNVVKDCAASLDQLQATPRLAIVSSVDPQTACARVLHQPEGILSGWLPILSSWTGNGWGLVCLPAPGDQVMVICHDGDAGSGVVVGGMFSDNRRVPRAPLGEFWLVHNSGSSLKIMNDGTVRIAGDLHVNGDIYDKAGPVSRLRAAYNSHTHNDALGRPTSASTTRDQ